MNLQDFHFLRPAWFLALLPLAALLLLLWRRHPTSRSWQAVVDPQLLPHLLTGTARQRNPWGIVAVALAGILAITALAGPVWSKQKQPVFRRDSALVVLLDLSQSMNAADEAPSRLQMAKFKLQDLLARRKEGETALVVYAAAPFTVTPLTNDIDNIKRQLGSLTPELMPAQGSRADRAITQAQALLQQAGASHGNVLLITDGIDNTPNTPLHEAVKKLLGAGYQLSVLGVGSTDGAPIPLQGGGFLQDNNGGIVVAKMDEHALEKLAAQGHGIYRHLNAGSDSDTNALSTTFAAGLTSKQGKRVAGIKSDQWREQGPWLLLPLLPLAALAFRRGYLLLLLFTLMIPVPRSAYAFGWNDLWQRPDQQAAAALAARQPKKAAKLFQDPQWRAAAHYRAGDYLAALDALKGHKGAEADYNRGNTLARLGKLPEALKAYEQALKQNPNLSDAKHNRDLVQKWLQQQQKKNGNDKQRQQSGKSNNQQQSQQSPQSGDKHKQNKADNGAQDNSANNSKKSQAANTDKQTQGQQPSASSANSKQEDKQAQAPSNNEANTTKQQQEIKPQQASAATSNNNQDSAEKNKKQKAVAGTTQPPEAQNNPQHSSSSALQADNTDKSKSTQATEQWLRRIPDDPGGLWRRKFLYQYKNAYQSQQGEAKPW